LKARSRIPSASSHPSTALGTQPSRSIPGRGAMMFWMTGADLDAVLRGRIDVVQLLERKIVMGRRRARCSSAHAGFLRTLSLRFLPPEPALGRMSRLVAPPRPCRSSSLQTAPSPWVPKGTCTTAAGPAARRRQDHHGEAPPRPSASAETTRPKPRPPQQMATVECTKLGPHATDQRRTRLPVASN
jgi:hypothetical protein